MTAAHTPDAGPGVGGPAPAYPVARPVSGDDPRFCFGLAYDIGKVLRQYGYPPVANGRDLVRLQLALFRFIYDDNEENTP